MKNLSRLLGSISLLLLLATVAICAQQNLRFVDQSGKPISDVVVRSTFTTMSPYPTPGGTFEGKSDADGRVTIIHPYGIVS